MDEYGAIFNHLSRPSTLEQINFLDQLIKDPKSKIDFKDLLPYISSIYNIEEQNERLDTLIESILDMSKVDDYKEALEIIDKINNFE